MNLRPGRRTVASRALEKLTSSKSRSWYNPRNGFMRKSCKRPIVLTLI